MGSIVEHCGFCRVADCHIVLELYPVFIYLFISVPLHV